MSKKNMQTPKYKLYVSYTNREITLTQNKSAVPLTVDEDVDTSEIYAYNNNYFVSDNRDALKSKAQDILDEWSYECYETLAKVKGIREKLHIK